MDFPYMVPRFPGVAGVVCDLFRLNFGSQESQIQGKL